MYWKWLLAILFLWWFRKAPPGPVTKLKAKVKHMSNINLTWKDPAVRADGTALDPSELAGIEVFVQAPGEPGFTKVTTVSAGVQGFTIVDAVPGGYNFQLDAVDTQVPPKVGATTSVSATVASTEKAAPGPVTDLAAVVV